MQESIQYKWRVVDIAVASVIGVVSSIVYWVAAVGYSVPWTALESVLPGFGGFMNGLWLFAAPLAAVIVRKPGAALYAEMLAAILELTLGNLWGVDTILIALVQGLFAEIVFAIMRYKVWNVTTVVLSGAVSGIGCWGYTFFTHLSGMEIMGAYGIMYLISTMISGAIVAGALMWYLYVAVAKTGALDAFASGRIVRGLA
ncbi:MAG: ECF transporter S component [Bifidobacteriaceae bacterium]|nr:ECF transporter S component [Bifidobacteriaceae bacterium]